MCVGAARGSPATGHRRPAPARRRLRARTAEPPPRRGAELVSASAACARAAPAHRGPLRDRGCGGARRPCPCGHQGRRAGARPRPSRRRSAAGEACRVARFRGVPVAPGAHAACSWPAGPRAVSSGPRGSADAHGPEPRSRPARHRQDILDGHRPVLAGCHLRRGGHGRTQPTPELLVDFSTALDVPAGDLAALTGVPLPRVFPNLRSAAAGLAELIWGVRRLTASQLQQVSDMAESMLR